jgi:hypothetical protein
MVKIAERIALTVVSQIKCWGVDLKISPLGPGKPLDNRVYAAIRKTASQSGSHF